MKSTSLAAGLVVLVTMSAAGAKEVAHPYILWTKDDIAAIKKKIDTQPWAKAALEQMNEPEWAGGKPFVDLFRYAVLGDEKAGKAQRDYLLSFIGAGTSAKSAEGGDVGRHYDCYLSAVRYDVLYDSLTPQQRKGIEDTFRKLIQFELDNPYVNTRVSLLPNMQLPRQYAAQVMSVALGDEQLIRKLWEAPSGFKWFMDDYLSDGSFYNEEFAKMTSLIGELLVYCRGLERLGLDELGYGYTGKGGGSMKSYVQSYIRLGYPRTLIPGGMPRYERIAMGDARGSMLGVFQHTIVNGALRQLPTTADSTGKKGESRAGREMFHSANMNGRDHRGAKVEKLGPLMWYEIIQARYPDSDFDYFLAQMRRPGQDQYIPTLLWGLEPIDPAKVKAPPAPSYVAPERGFAMLRAEESPAYWESSAPAVALQFATLYVHYNPDCFSLLGYHAFNRPIYLNRTISAGYAGGPWDFSVRGHCGVVVDGLQAQPIGQVPATSDFTPLAKFVSARGELKPGAEGYKGRGEVRSLDQPKTPATQVYPNIDLSRSLMLTREYLFDVYALADKSQQPRQYHWLVHAPGVINDDNAWKDSTELQNTLMNVVPSDLPKNDGQDFSRQYRIPTGPDAPPAEKSWIRISKEKKLEATDKPLAITVLQSCILPDSAASTLGKEWYDRKIGVRVRMLGEPGTSAFSFDTPTCYPPGTPRAPQGEGPRRPETGGVSIAIARSAPATMFVALHEPFENGAPKIDQFRRIAQTSEAVAAAITGKDINDRVLLDTGRSGEPVTLAGEGESFTFAGHAFIRITPEKVEATGDLRAMTLKVDTARKLILNGKETPVKCESGTMVK